MFEQPLTAIRATGTKINLSLVTPELPKPFDSTRWGKSVSFIAREAANLGIALPKPETTQRTDTFSPAYKTDENIYPELLGDVVEFLAARMTIGKDEAESLYFPQACKQINDLYEGASWDELSEARRQVIIDDLARLNSILNAIDCEALSYSGIVAACELVAFWNSDRGGRKHFCSDKKQADGSWTCAMDIIPNKPCARNIYKMTIRTMNKMQETDGVQSYQFSYPTSLLRDHKNGINGGRLDFVADNEIWDIKTNTKAIDDKEKLQVLIYLAFMQRVETKNPVKKCGIIDVRKNEVIEYDWDKIPFITKYQLDRLIEYKWNDVSDRYVFGRKSALTLYQENELKGLLGV